MPSPSIRVGPIRTTTRTISFIAFAVLLLVGCARTELARAKQARADYQECVAENPRDTKVCEDLRTAMNQAYDRYDAVSQERARNWRDEQDLPR